MRTALRPLVLLGLLASPLAAQDVPPVDPSRDASEADALRKRRSDLAGFRPGGALEAAKGPAPIEGGPCFPITRITLDGATLLQPEEIDALVKADVGRCLQGADIQRLMERIDQSYAGRGHITTRSYLPPQNIASGQLVLQVVEGRVAHLVMVDKDGAGIDTPRSRRQLALAFPGVKAELFQLRDFEQGLDQMNRLKSVQAVMQLQPGAVPGESDVVVQRSQQDWLRGVLTLNNKGARSTGRNRLEFELEADDAFGLNDSWSFGYDGTQNTNAISGDGSIPLGYWTLALEASYSEYLLPLGEMAELFGRSGTAGGSLTRMLARDQVSTTEASIGVKHRWSERFVNGAALTPQVLSTVRLGGKHIRQIGDSRWSFDAGLTLGTKAFGATADAAGIAADMPHAQFWKLDGGVFRAAPLGDWAALQTDLRVQLARVPLYPAEQLALGSETTVRGYEGAQALGDKGFYMRNDLLVGASALNAFWQKGQRPDWSRNLQLTGFFDVGAAYDHGTGDWGKVAGLGVGLGYATPRGAVNLTVAAPLVGQDGDFGIGEPLVQINLAAKAF